MLQITTHNINSSPIDLAQRSNSNTDSIHLYQESITHPLERYILSHIRGRSDLPPENHFNLVMWTNKFELIDTIDPSYFDLGYIRSTPFVILKHIASNKTYAIMSLHIPLSYKEKRYSILCSICADISKLDIGYKIQNQIVDHVIIGGDFNTNLEEFVEISPILRNIFDVDRYVSESKSQEIFTNYGIVDKNIDLTKPIFEQLNYRHRIDYILGDISLMIESEDLTPNSYQVPTAQDIIELDVLHKLDKLDKLDKPKTKKPYIPKKYRQPQVEQNTYKEKRVWDTEQKKWIVAQTLKTYKITSIDHFEVCTNFYML